MNVSPQMLVEPVMFVITHLAPTDVNVKSDLLLILVHRIQGIPFVSVRC